MKEVNIKVGDMMEWLSGQGIPEDIFHNDNFYQGEELYNMYNSYCIYSNLALGSYLNDLCSDLVSVILEYSNPYVDIIDETIEKLDSFCSLDTTGMQFDFLLKTLICALRSVKKNQKNFSPPCDIKLGNLTLESKNSNLNPIYTLLYICNIPLVLSDNPFNRIYIPLKNFLKNDAGLQLREVTNYFQIVVPNLINYLAQERILQIIDLEYKKIPKYTLETFFEDWKSKEMLENFKETIENNSFNNQFDYIMIHTGLYYGQIPEVRMKQRERCLKVLNELTFLSQLRDGRKTTVSLQPLEPGMK